MSILNLKKECPKKTAVKVLEPFFEQMVVILVVVHEVFKPSLFNREGLLDYPVCVCICVCICVSDAL